MDSRYSDTIELGHVVRTVVRGWRAVVVTTVLAIVAGVGLIMFAPRKFTGRTTVVLKSGGSSSSGSSVLSQISGLGDLTAGLLGGKSLMETEIEIMSSRAVIGDVVDTLRLQARVLGATMPTVAIIDAVNAPSPFRPKTYRFVKTNDGAGYRFSGAGESGVMTPGTPVHVTPGTVTFARAAALPSEFELRLLDRDDAIDRVAKHLKVDKEKGEIASIVYKGDDSVTAASVPNKLLDVYFRRRRGTDRGINQRRVEFLTAKSDTMERELVATAAALRRQQESSGFLDPKAVAKVELESGASTRAKLTDVLVEQGALDHLMEQINAKSLNPQDLAAYPRFIGSPIINNLVTQLIDFDTRRTVLLADHVATDRAVVTLDKSAADVEAKILPYARTYADALTREHADLQTSLDRINANLARLPKAEESSEQLENEVLGITKLLGGVQGQIVEAKIAAIGEGGDVRPLDLATPSKKPSFPVPMLVMAIAVLGGLFFGAIAALLISSVGRWMRDPVEVERTTGVPAVRFDPAVPLFLAGASRTIVVAPIGSGAVLEPVVRRLAETAASRSLSTAVLDLSASTSDVNGAIARLEGSHDLVIVQLSSLASDSAGAALQHTRPVLLVGPRGRIDRRRLIDAMRMLKRIEVPVAGIVMSNGTVDDRSLTG